MTWIVRKLIFPRIQSTSITKRSFSLFDSLTAYYSCMTWNLRKQVSLRFQCTSITNRVLSVFDRFTAYYNCMTWNVRKLMFSRSEVHKYHKSLFFAYLTILRFITVVWPEMSENSYLRDFSAQVSQNCLHCLFERFTAYYNFMTWSVEKMVSPQFEWASITNRFLSLIEDFAALLQLVDLKCQKTHI